MLSQQSIFNMYFLRFSFSFVYICLYVFTYTLITVECANREKENLLPPSFRFYLFYFVLFIRPGVIKESFRFVRDIIISVGKRERERETEKPKNKRELRAAAAAASIGNNNKKSNKRTFRCLHEKFISVSFFFCI